MGMPTAYGETIIGTATRVGRTRTVQRRRCGERWTARATDMVGGVQWHADEGEEDADGPGARPRRPSGVVSRDGAEGPDHTGGSRATWLHKWMPWMPSMVVWEVSSRSLRGVPSETGGPRCWATRKPRKPECATTTWSKFWRRRTARRRLRRRTPRRRASRGPGGESADTERSALHNREGARDCVCEGAGGRLRFGFLGGVRARPRLGVHTRLKLGLRVRFRRRIRAKPKEIDTRAELGVQALGSGCASAPGPSVKDMRAEPRVIDVDVSVELGTSARGSGSGSAPSRRTLPSASGSRCRRRCRRLAFRRMSPTTTATHLAPRQSRGAAQSEEEVKRLEAASVK